MKKTALLSFVLILVSAIALSSCVLPVPGQPTPSVPESTQPQASPISSTATTGAAEAAAQSPTQTSAPPTATRITGDETIPAATDTPVPPSPTPQAPTATPVTPPPAPQVTRIEFQSGRTTASVSGELDGGETERYAIQGAASQNLTVDVWSPNGDVYLAVTGMTGGEPLLEATAKSGHWTGALPSAQDYMLSVTAAGGITSYSIDVTVGGA
ncbi:MAG: hypothetical protein EHM70_21075, partial [Chloroflexota bacterium]